jgi:tetratricopeptide (TPR) repeat protein
MLKKLVMKLDETKATIISNFAIMKVLISAVYIIFYSHVSIANDERNKYFLNNLSNKVISIEVGKERVFVIQTILESCNNCDKSTISKKLDLYSKLNLVRFLNQDAKEPISYELSALRKLEAGYYQNRHFLVSILNYKNIKKLKLNKTESIIDVGSFANTQDLMDKLATYESLVDTEPENEYAWDGLYKIYMKLGELEKANQAMDKLIQLKLK